LKAVNAIPMTIPLHPITSTAAIWILSEGSTTKRTGELGRVGGRGRAVGLSKRFGGLGIRD